MNIATARLGIRIAAALLLGIGIAAAPALTYAQHMSGGGAHMGGVGGGHFGGGGGAHYGGGVHFGGSQRGFAGAHMGSYGGAHYASPAHSGYAYHGAAYGAAHGYPSAHAGYVSGRSGYVAHPGGGYYGGSAYYQGGHYWGGGYYHGGYWPYTYYRPGWAWYYPVLPIGYATFWWGGIPYYYSNNLYYTWNPGYNGYVVTDPPPTAGSDEGGAMGDDPSAVNAAPAPQGQGFQGGTAADLYVYPRNGQSDAQSSTDRYECHSWAVNQTGFDPTRAGQNGGNADAYQRAMVACLDARGYSAR